jgi:hypothetical protein
MQRLSQVYRKLIKVIKTHKARKEEEEFEEQQTLGRSLRF